MHFVLTYTVTVSGANVLLVHIDIIKSTAKSLSIATHKSEQQSRLGSDCFKEQSDQGLHCLPQHLDHLNVGKH